MPKSKSISDTLSEFCVLMDEVPKSHDWNYSEVHRLDLLTQDYLHKLELVDLDYASRAKLATSLAKTRKERRKAKDMEAVLKPLADLLMSPQGKQLYNLTRQVLGETRKIESQQSGRVYIPRILEDGPYMADKDKEDEDEGIKN